jgi:two-component system response regulator
MNNANILLVEDNDDDVALTLRAFQKSKIANSVVVARDGVEALDYLFGTGTHQGRDTSLLPAIILLDLKLPRIDGLEVLRRIKQDSTLKLIRTIILTSSNEGPDVHTSYELGACSYIRKPVDFDKFVDAVATLGIYWLLLNEALPNQRPPQ